MRNSRKMISVLDFSDLNGYNEDDNDSGTNFGILQDMNS